MATTPFGSKRSGGPRTQAGKAAASGNAFKGGLSLNVLINDGEQAQYQELLEQLLDEYAPRGPTMALLLQSFAMAVVKRRRQDRVESAMYEKAQVTADYMSRQPARASFASYLPATPDGQRRARQIVVSAAMPELQRVDALARYGASLDRQLARLWTQIQAQHLTECAKAASEEAAAEDAAKEAAKQAAKEAPDEAPGAASQEPATAAAVTGSAANDEC